MVMIPMFCKICMGVEKPAGCEAFKPCRRCVRPEERKQPEKRFEWKEIVNMHVSLPGVVPNRRGFSSYDNGSKMLEDHVSKYGWNF
jgi:hypothetical protein